jgi:hypothetical protein
MVTIYENVIYRALQNLFVELYLATEKLQTNIPDSFK